jgi:hypothetical protein
LALSVSNAHLGSLDVRIYGEPLAGGGVQMTSSAVSLGTAARPTLYTGAVTGLDGTNVEARVTSPGGHTLALAIYLQIDGATGATSGSVQVTPE